MSMLSSHWHVGLLLGQYLQSIQTLGADGVEERLRQIREETFKRMRNHPNNSLSWKQICARLNLCEKCGRAKHEEI